MNNTLIIEVSPENYVTLEFFNADGLKDGQQVFMVPGSYDMQASELRDILCEEMKVVPRFVLSYYECDKEGQHLIGGVFDAPFCRTVVKLLAHPSWTYRTVYRKYGMCVIQGNRVVSLVVEDIRDGVDELYVIGYKWRIIISASDDTVYTLADGTHDSEEGIVRLVKYFVSGFYGYENEFHRAKDSVPTA